MIRLYCQYIKTQVIKHIKTHVNENMLAKMQSHIKRWGTLCESHRMQYGKPSC